MKRIRELRKERGLSQSDLAQKLKISQGMISYWERDDFEPNITMLSRLADLFNVTVDYLLERTDRRESISSVDDLYLALAREAQARRLPKGAVKSVIASLDEYMGS
ncbi:MAG: helix-turn-helix domain-containing protein [Oscillospiraceae bacterium]|jgi:transcriptional regulator with XRE-family HTH domain|nr:helix-turn-helix domain-containing protein [Oscillospiraceae bacterium]